MMIYMYGQRWAVTVSSKTNMNDAKSPITLHVHPLSHHLSAYPPGEIRFTDPKTWQPTQIGKWAINDYIEAMGKQNPQFLIDLDKGNSTKQSRRLR